MIEDNRVAEKYQIIISVSNSFLPFTGLPSPRLPIVSSLILCLKMKTYQIISSPFTLLPSLPIHLAHTNFIFKSTCIIAQCLEQKVWLKREWMNECTYELCRHCAAHVYYSLPGWPASMFRIPLSSNFSYRLSGWHAAILGRANVIWKLEHTALFSKIWSLTVLDFS